MTGKRRSFQGQLTTQVAIEALKNKRPGSDLTGEYLISAGQIPTGMASDQQTASVAA